MNTIRASLVVGGLLLGGLALPRTSYAITGCTNAYLNGTYNAQISSLNFLTIVNTLNQGAGSTGGTGTGGSAGETAVTANFGGFGNNARSLSGKTPGLGRYYFDGNGNIVGSGSAGSTPMNVRVGTYNVSGDCSATMSLDTGETFNAVLTDSGARAFFLESDAAGQGAVGMLERSTNSCFPGNDFPQSLGFTYFGGTTTTPSGTGTGTSTTTATTVSPYSAVGSINLTGNGTFNMRQWVFQSGAARTANANGTYTIGSDCSIRLNFVSGTQTGGGSTGAFVPPVAFRGLLVDQSSGLVSIQTDANTTVTGFLGAQ